MSVTSRCDKMATQKSPLNLHRKGVASKISAALLFRPACLEKSIEQIRISCTDNIDQIRNYMTLIAPAQFTSIISYFNESSHNTSKMPSLLLFKIRNGKGVRIPRPKILK